jgi:hypothetical protein
MRVYAQNTFTVTEQMAQIKFGRYYQMGGKSRSKSRKAGWVAPTSVEKRWQRTHCSKWRELFLDPDRLAYPMAPKRTCKPSVEGKQAARERLRLNESAHKHDKDKYLSKGKSYSKLNKRAKILGLKKKVTKRSNKTPKKQ